jgi:hypothetical protein
MVIAGIRKVKIHGARLKKGFTSAKPLSRILYSPEKTNKNNPQTIRNIPITKYPIGEEKKDCISLFSIANIFLQLSVVSCLFFFVWRLFLKNSLNAFLIYGVLTPKKAI